MRAIDLFVTVNKTTVVDSHILFLVAGAIYVMGVTGRTAHAVHKVRQQTVRSPHRHADTVVKPLGL